MKEDTHNNEGNSTLLDSLPKLNCYRVPTGYFNRLHQAIEVKVQLEGLAFEDALSKLKNAQPYNLPANYFDSLADKIAQKTQGVELPQESGFTVPEGYFGTLYLKIVDRVAEENAPAKVWWQNAGVVLRPALAVAAVVIVAVFIALPYIGNKNQPTQVQPLANNTTQPKSHDNKHNSPGNTAQPIVAVPEVKTVAQTVKKSSTIKGTSKPNIVNTTGTVDEVAELFDYTDDFNAEGLLSEVPEKTSDEYNSLVEIVSEGNVDLADLMDGM